MANPIVFLYIRVGRRPTLEPGTQGTDLAMPPPAFLSRPAIVVALATVMMSVFVGMFFAWAWAMGRLRAGRSLLPTDAPRIVPWGGGSVLAGLLTIVSLSASVSAIYRAVTGRSSDTSQLDVMLLSALINVTLLGVMPLILWATARARPEDYGLAWNRLRRDASVGFVAFLLIAPIIYGIQFIAAQVWERNEHPVELMMLENLTGRVAILAIVSAVFLAPAVEELLFRGLFQGWLTRLLVPKPEAPDLRAPDLDEWIADEPTAEPLVAPTRRRLLPRIPDPVRSALPVLLTSSVFALVHMPQWPAPLAIFLLSLGLGEVYQRTGSLVASFVLHAAFNGLSTLALILVALNPGPLDKRVAPLPPDAAIGAVHVLDASVHQPRQGERPRHCGIRRLFSWTHFYMADTVLPSRSTLVSSTRPCLRGRTTCFAASSGDAGSLPPASSRDSGRFVRPSGR